MRAAFDREKDTLTGAAETAGDSLNLLFVYSGGKDQQGTPFRFDLVSLDMNTLCKKVCASAGRKRV